MSNNKYILSSFAIFLINIVCCHSYANYEFFKGFDLYNMHRQTTKDSLETVTSHTYIPTVRARNVTTDKKLTSTIKPKGKLKAKAKKCPENEKPVSLGTYEIPTEQDLMLFTKRTLVKMFNSYHEKTLILLKDIKEATRATEVFEKKCRGKHKESYKKCVKHISKKCVTITKDLVAIMEQQKESVADLLEGTTCSMMNMKTDPIQLVLTLAMDAASLEFALPAFLRLIGGCSVHCSKSAPTAKTIRRPSRHMTDQDLVVKHFLTSKNYIQLIKDSDTHVSGSKNAALVNWMHSTHS